MPYLLHKYSTTIVPLSTNRKGLEVLTVDRDKLSGHRLSTEADTAVETSFEIHSGTCHSIHLFLTRMPPSISYLQRQASPFSSLLVNAEDGKQQTGHHLQ